MRATKLFEKLNQINDGTRTLFESIAIPEVAFIHKETHVEVEVVVPKNINVSSEIADMVYRTAKVSNGIRIASPSGLVALKLHRNSPQDMADIINLTKIEQIDLSFGLTVTN